MDRHEREILEVLISAVRPAAATVEPIIAVVDWKPKEDPADVIVSEADPAPVLRYAPPVVDTISWVFVLRANSSFRHRRIVACTLGSSGLTSRERQQDLVHSEPLQDFEQQTRRRKRGTMPAIPATRRLPFSLQPLCGTNPSRPLQPGAKRQDYAFNGDRRSFACIDSSDVQRHLWTADDWRQKAPRCSRPMSASTYRNLHRLRIPHRRGQW